jgi:DNA replication protein DnaC
MKTAAASTDPPSLPMLLRKLKLPSFVSHYAEVARKAESAGWTFQEYLHHLAEQELTDRQERRIERNRRRSGLPADKTLAMLKLERLPRKVQTQIPALSQGDFVERAENLLAFGLPGRGKTHVVCAIGHELVACGYRVLFQSAYSLVQMLLLAKKELMLERQLRRLDAFEIVIIDDIGYIQQSREEMEVLFTFLSERYERRAVAITSNLVFSEWDKIFKDPMTTAAAIDRVVHHSTILELTGPSYRAEEAQERNHGVDPQETKSEDEETKSEDEETKKPKGKKKPTG